MGNRFWQDRPVPVTGASGLLGGWLVRKLQEQQADVVWFLRERVPQSGLVRKAVLTSLFQYISGILLSLLVHQIWFRGTIDNWWFLHNDSLGAPFGLDAYDYPQSECLHMVIAKAISVASANCGVVYNTYALLTSPLTTLCALFALRRLNVPYGLAMVARPTITIPPGRHRVQFLCDAHEVNLRAFQIFDYTLEEEPG